MSLIIPCNGISPIIGENCFIAPNASIIGDVNIGKYGSVWFNAVLRGDVNKIIIGDYTNIQDGAILHGTYQKSYTQIGDYVSIGHGAIVHGCNIGHHVLIGMGSIVMDDAEVDPYTIIGAGALILSNTKCESGYIYVGNPAKKIKEISEEQRIWLDNLPFNYVLYSSWFKI